MRRFLWLGLAIWLIATVVIRVSGEHLFKAQGGNPPPLLFALTALAIAVPVSLLVRSLPTRDAALRATVLLVLPGMLLDTGSVLWFRVAFPNLPESARAPFASLLLWAYGIALLAGLGPRKASPSAAGDM